MKRLKKLIKDHKSCWYVRNTYRIKWRIERLHKDLPAACFFLIPTIEYVSYPYRHPGAFVFNIYFLHWYIGIGEWCNKEDNNAE